ncbi:MAG: hypothetical protein R3195_16620 [Gemmatimonadota bacterium]|nr:hypothetical protein [Gemmatimonadota bacterium]
MPRLLDIDGFEWTVSALPQKARRREADPWHYARVRYEPHGHDEGRPREAWLRIEEDIPANDVLDQYSDEYLAEAYLIAEIVDGAEG